ncbi:MAG: DNA adenine methylase [Alistipes sp.]|nr:DNA adenine methylase [Alistipes sp.]
MIKSPLRYPGGKNRAVDFISQYIPSDFNEFREPFVGGGSVFIHTKQQYPDKQFWINDLYGLLHTFWREMQHNAEAVISQVEAWRGSFEDGKELYCFLNNNIEIFDPIRKAAAFFTYNRITFSGTTLSGGFSNSAFEKRFTDSSISRLRALVPLLSNMQITNFDYADVVNAPGDNVFIFLDPPYYTASKSALYGTNGNMHKGFDHERFAQTMRNCRHRWLITYDDCPYIRSLFDFAYITPWVQSYGMKNVGYITNQSGKELLISNYKLSDINNGSQLELF